MIDNSKEVQKMRVLDQVLYIYYLVQFQKDKGKDVLTLINSGSEINTMTPPYAAKLGLKVQKIDVNTQKLIVLY